MEQYQRAGVEVVADHTDLQEYISSECESLYFLASLEAEAWMADSGSEANKWLSFEGGFLTKHLGVYIFDFAAAVKLNACIPFYPEITTLCEQFIAGEMNRVKLHGAISIGFLRDLLRCKNQIDGHKLMNTTPLSRAPRRACC